MSDDDSSRGRGGEAPKGPGAAGAADAPNALDAPDAPGAGAASPPARDMLGAPGRFYLSPGARKERLRERRFEAAAPKPPRPQRYAELRAASAFSFLGGASLPEDLVERAAALGLPAVALADAGGVYGAPRFYKAARQAGLKAIVGSELALDARSRFPDGPPRDSLRAGPLGLVPPPPSPTEAAPRLTLLVESRVGYQNLCKLVTAGALGKPKGAASVSWGQVAAHTEGLHVLTGGDEGPLAQALLTGGLPEGRRLLERLGALFPGRVHVELQRHRRPDEEHLNRARIELARSLGLPLVATNGVKYARAANRPLFDVLTCVKNHTSVDRAGRLLDVNRERHLKGAEEMASLFADLPGVLERSADLADRLAFTLEDLGYRFPDYPVPPGETLASHLRHATWEGARARFRPLSARAQAQIEKELALIEKLELAGYFLIVWDLVNFCKRKGYLVQGRGSAANSAVCYALSITAIDPVKMDLLFERFLSEERGEWPDIDLDLPSGDAREAVIQYVYERYGRLGAAMTANVITYRDRSAARETAKALGFSAEQVDRIAKSLGRWSFGEYRSPAGDHGSQDDAPDRPFAREMRDAGFDPDDLRLRHFEKLFSEVQNLPRHLGQHSGGMVVAAGRLDEVVPLEPAAMEGRVVIQWDKDDCADLGIIKIDLLGLGMLGAIAEMIPTIREKEGVTVDLAHLPPDDPKVYRMLNEADTVGLFQVESRAQMASLPRNAPRCFYDLVIQVAIIRPGPIVGGMVHPFFDRRRGREPVTYPHPSLEPILKRTLGVPLFQEQLLRIAMVAAGFTGGEAEELRRAMGFKRSVERMASIEKRLRDGMARNGIEPLAQEQIVKAITSFALYGFPESHAASFALLAYASGYLKAHHPAAFFVSLLNAWPMGFYHPATLVKDAERRGTKALPIDVNASGWMSRWEDFGIRLGLRFVKGLRRQAGEAVEREAARAPFASVKELARRCALRDEELANLAHVGAFGSLGEAGTRLTRRTALWQAAEAARDAGPLWDRDASAPSPLVEMTPFEETCADYTISEMTAGPHLIAHVREKLRALGVLSAAELAARADGEWVRAGGAVIVRQRPGTAKGFVFLSIEDETGICQAIIRPDLFRENRTLVVSSPALVVEGRLQKKDGALSVKARRFFRLPLGEGEAWHLEANARPNERPTGRKEAAPIPSHDFH